MLALATASLIAGGQAIAQGRGGGQGGGHGGGQGMGQGVGNPGMGQGVGRIDTRIDADVGQRGIEARTEARANARAPERASDRAIERANENSVLAGTERPPVADLSGLREGLTVRSSAGAEIGTIRRVNRSSDGSVRSVLVASADGQRTIPVRPMLGSPILAFPSGRSLATCRQPRRATSPGRQRTTSCPKMPSARPWPTTTAAAIAP